MTRLFTQMEWASHFVKILSILGLTLLSVLASPGLAHAAANSLEHARNTELTDEPLTAIAGRHRSAFVGETVELAGDAVNLNGASAVSYTWALLEAPRQSTSTLFLGDTRNPFLFVDREGIYVVELVVSDGRRKSAPARIVISTPQPARQFATPLSPNAARGGVDTDGDGITDEIDNCIEIANSDQRDTDGDLFGNACDADFNNDGIVNAQDLGLLRLAFFGTPLTPNWNPDADFNADDIVNAIDLGRFKALFFMPPGPSGLLPGINCGEFLTGTIDEPNDGDFYQLFLNAGQAVELAVSQTVGFVGSAARAFVYAPDGTLALVGTAQSQTTLIAAQTGIHQVVVRAANGFATGSYGIGLICISPAAPVIANLDCGDLATGTIDAAGEAKIYTFDAQAGDLLAVSIGQSTGFVGAAARAFVYSPDGSFLTTFTAQSQGLFTATLSGRYVIKVAASNFFATGSYSIGISCLNPVDPDATNLACGDLVISTIDQAGEADLYTFSAQAGDVLTVTMAQSSGFAGTAARAQVFSPAGDFLATFTAQEQTLFTAPVAGVYVVKVAAANFFAQGTYSIGINCISPVDAQATALGCGDLEVSTIDVFGEADLYTFDVEAGAILTVTMAQSSGFAGTAARAWVYSPTGEPLGVYTAQQQGLFTAAESGTHIIKIAAANFFATGTYAIGLTCINPIDAADGTLACGTPVASSISSFGEADLYTFDAQAGDELTMTMAQSAGFIGSVARAQLFSPTGQFLATYTAQSNTVFSVPESGTYALKVAAANFFATGDYTVGKVCVFPTSPVVADIACNTSESANIVQVGESDLFTFSATTGDDLTISLTQTAGFAGTVARAWLFSPSGQSIALYTANSSNAFVPAQTGTFILRVAAANVIGTGDVDLGLTCN